MQINRIYYSLPLDSGVNHINQINIRKPLSLHPSLFCTLLSSKPRSRSSLFLRDLPTRVYYNLIVSPRHVRFSAPLIIPNLIVLKLLVKFKNYDGLAVSAILVLLPIEVQTFLKELSSSFFAVCRLSQCFSTAEPRPGTGPWHQLYRTARGSPGISHFSFLSIFHE